MRIELGRSLLIPSSMIITNGCVTWLEGIAEIWIARNWLERRFTAPAHLHYCPRPPVYPALLKPARRLFLSSKFPHHWFLVTAMVLWIRSPENRPNGPSLGNRDRRNEGHPSIPNGLATDDRKRWSSADFHAVCKDTPPPNEPSASSPSSSLFISQNRAKFFFRICKFFVQWGS